MNASTKKMTQLYIGDTEIYGTKVVRYPREPN